MRPSKNDKHYSFRTLEPIRVARKKGACDELGNCVPGPTASLGQPSLPFLSLSHTLFRFRKSGQNLDGILAFWNAESFAFAVSCCNFTIEFSWISGEKTSLAMSINAYPAYKASLS